MGRWILRLAICPRCGREHEAPFQHGMPARKHQTEAGYLAITCHSCDTANASDRVRKEMDRVNDTIMSIARRNMPGGHAPGWSEDP